MYQRFVSLLSLLVMSLVSTLATAGETTPRRPEDSPVPCESPSILAMVASYRASIAKDEAPLKSALNETIGHTQEQNRLPGNLLNIIVEYAKPCPITVVNELQPDSKPSRFGIPLAVAVHYGEKKKLINPHETFVVQNYESNSVVGIEFVCDEQGSLAFIRVPISSLFEDVRLKISRNMLDKVIVEKFIGADSKPKSTYHQNVQV